MLLQTTDVLFLFTTKYVVFTAALVESGVCLLYTSDAADE